MSQKPDGARAPQDQSAGFESAAERTPTTPLFDRAVVGIALVNPEGRWLRFNQRFCDILGYSREELPAHPWQDVAAPDDRADRASFSRLRAGELDAYDFDKRRVRPDGATVWVHLTISRERAAQGEPDYFVSMVEDITERKRLEQDRAQLLEQERAAHAEAEATNEKLRALLALTDAALSRLLLDDLLRELLGRVTAVMGVDSVAIILLDADGQTLTVRAARGPAEEWIGREHAPVGQGFVGRVAASWEPLIVNDTASFQEMSPRAREQVRSVVGVPLLVQDQVEGRLVSRLVGVVHVGSATPRRFTEADVQLLQRTADRIALAISRALVYGAEQDAHLRAEAALGRAVVSETQATERAERLRAILESMEDGVAVLDPQGRIVQVNRAYHALSALEHAPAGFLGMSAHDRSRLLNIRDAATGAPLSPEDTAVGRALRGEVVTGPRADFRIRAFDGREREVYASSAPLREADGRIVGAVMLLRDMTERKQLERERKQMERERESARADELAAREVNRRMEVFVATATHDLRTPLTATLGYLAIAARASERLAVAAREACPTLAPGAEAVRERMGDADQSAARLSRLIDMLFDTAAIRAGRLDLHRAPCDLVALVREQVEPLRVAAPDRTIRLQGPSAGEPISVEADADRIGEVVTNYVTNALKHSPPDRPVDVSVETHRNRARVAVRDEGSGLPKEALTRVWELFYRASGGAAQAGTHDGPQGGSLGLGLYICKAIIAAHGGRVGVKSAVGEGSTFWFTLPRLLPPSDSPR